MKIDYPFIAYCYQRYFDCLMEGIGVDEYISHGRNHAYVIGMPLNAESNCFIISGKFLISLWFDPVEHEVYGELRYSEDYAVHSSGVYSMRSMKVSGTLTEYRMVAVLTKGSLSPTRIEDWLTFARYKVNRMKQEK